VRWCAILRTVKVWRRRDGDGTRRAGCILRDAVVDSPLPTAEPFVLKSRCPSDIADGKRVGRSMWPSTCSCYRRR